MNQKSVSSEFLTHPKYRSDIDGLRALAVLSVVIFHAFPSVLTGGFIGVDIFFVISGFLISSIIIENLEKDRFSFIEFYSRRIRRIYPALIVVLIVCFVFGWFVLFADEFARIGKHLAGGAAFVSNLVLSSELGYFDHASETKPLLHLWSLAVEEQFYIVWPLLVWLCWKRKFNFLLMAIGLSAMSFIVCHYIVNRNHTVAFYSPFTRFWELLMGSILAYMSTHKQNIISVLENQLKNYVGKVFPELSLHWDSSKSILGLALILVGVVWINKFDQFPGWRAFFPTFGAVLLISAGHQAWCNRHALSSRVLVWFGLISYPLYLWHWPLLSYISILGGGKPSVLVAFIAVVASVVLAWITYLLVEKPIRKGGNGQLKVKVLFLLMLAVGAVGYVTYKQHGLDFRLGARERLFDYFENEDPEQRYFTKIDMKEKARAQCDFYDNDSDRYGHATNEPLPNIANECYVRNPHFANAVMLWGDSHAQQLNYGLKQNLPTNWQILQVTTSGCAANVDNLEPSHTDACVESNWFAVKTISEVKPDVVIIAQRDGHDANKFKHIAEKLKVLGVKKVIFLGPTPHWTADLPRIVYRQLWGHIPKHSYVDIDQQIMLENTQLQTTFKSTSSVVELDLIKFFCDKGGCLIYLGNNISQGLVSFDYGHLTPMASSYLAKNLLVSKVVDVERKAN